MTYDMMCMYYTVRIYNIFYKPLYQQMLYWKMKLKIADQSPNNKIDREQARMSHMAETY